MSQLVYFELPDRIHDQCNVSVVSSVKICAGGMSGED